MYWYPLYAFVRRQNHPEADALDLVQSFCAQLLERGGLDGANEVVNHGAEQTSKRG